MKIMQTIAKILMPLILGGAILYWMYRGEDWQSIKDVMLHEMNWTWMLLSFPFGILAQAFRGWRWQQTLEPIGEEPRASICINAIFLSSVVTERAVDTLIVMLYSGIILLFSMSTFGTFFKKTGTSFEHILSGFSLTGWVVAAICGAAVLLLLHLLLKNLSIYNKVKMTMHGIWEGVFSLKDVKNLPLYLFFSVGIWVMYFLHYYLTFFCFDFTENLGIGCALVSFVVDVDGSVTDVTVIKGVENLLDWEAQRIVKRLPRFSPGIRNGRPSRFRYTLPVNFKLT